jgi:SAM-dependent methyltransferase
MAQKDKQHWDKKHAQNMMSNTPIKLLEEYVYLATGKNALDIACGNGRHSRYLASLGFKVDALDISSVAIEQLQGVENIHAVEVDFDTYTLKPNQYDIIVCTYYLERTLFPQMLKALKTNALILFETFVQDEGNERKHTNPDFILKKGEIEDYFSKECEILHLQEFLDIDYQGFEMMKASMVAIRKD